MGFSREADSSQGAGCRGGAPARETPPMQLLTESDGAASSVQPRCGWGLLEQVHSEAPDHSVVNSVASGFSKVFPAGVIKAHFFFTYSRKYDRKGILYSLLFSCRIISAFSLV